MLRRNITGLTAEISEYEDALPLAEAGGYWDERIPQYHQRDNGHIAPGCRGAHLAGSRGDTFRRSAQLGISDAELLEEIDKQLRTNGLPPRGAVLLSPD